MNAWNRKLYLLAVAAVVLAAGCRYERRASDETRATITRNWPAANIREIKVFEVDGSISIEASSSGEVSLVATAKGDLELKKGEENDGLFTTSLDGDTLSIGRKGERRRGWNIGFIWDTDDLRIDYVLKVPPSVSLNVSTVNGKIATRGVSGETEAATVNGTIDIDTPGTHRLYATTVNGRVKARFSESFQGARFKTVNGGVTATLPQTASFTVNLSQVNGDFEASFPLSIHSNPGSRRVSGEVNGGEHELKIVTVNGDVELARLGE
jgi:hypothetical protein